MALRSSYCNLGVLARHSQTPSRHALAYDKIHGIELKEERRSSCLQHNSDFLAVVAVYGSGFSDRQSLKRNLV
jgi:hypothetical protein